MIVFVRTLVLAAITNNLSLVFAAWLFDAFTIEPLGFVVAVVLFTVLTVVLREIVVGTVNKFARGYTIIGGLVLTWVALALTDLVSPAEGFAINGLGTWTGVTLIVWAAGVAYGEVDQHAPTPR